MKVGSVIELLKASDTPYAIQNPDTCEEVIQSWVPTSDNYKEDEETIMESQVQYMTYRTSPYYPRIYIAVEYEIIKEKEFLQ